MLVGALGKVGVGSSGISIGAGASDSCGTPLGIESSVLSVDGSGGEPERGERVVDIDLLKSVAVGNVDAHGRGHGGRRHIGVSGPIPVRRSERGGGSLVLSAILRGIGICNGLGAFNKDLLEEHNEGTVPREKQVFLCNSC